MLGASLVPAFQTVLLPRGFENAAPNVVKWFGAFCAHPTIVKHFGTIKTCSKAMKPQAPGKPDPKTLPALKKALTTIADEYGDEEEEFAELPAEHLQKAGSYEPGAKNKLGLVSIF